MNEAQKKVYASKYFRTGAEVRLAKEENPFPQMKYDSVRLLSTPDFGNQNTSTYWQFICAPLVMYPDFKRNDRGRYLTLMGGDMRNTLILGGTVEIAIGSNIESLQRFTYDKAVAVYVPPGLLYSVTVVKITDAKYPILFNEFAFGPSVVGMLPEDFSDYEGLFKSGEEIWFRRHPFSEVNLPCVGFGNKAFGGKETLCRKWMPVSKAFEMESKTHTHDFDKFVCFTGTNQENMLDLGGEIEFTIGEEGKELIKFTSSVACQFFIKKGLLHSPLVFKRVDNPNKPILISEISFTDYYDFNSETGYREDNSEYELLIDSLNTELTEL